MQLYHYTCLFHLPKIMAEGLLPSGNLPLDDTGLAKRSDQITALNLTTNPNRQDQLAIWCNTRRCPVDKSVVRFTLDLPEEELMSWRAMREKFKPRGRIVKLLSPITERRHWFYWFKTVPPSDFVSVEVWQTDNGYCAIPDMALLLAKIEQEQARVTEVVNGEPYVLDDKLPSWLVGRPCRVLTTD